MQIKPYIFLIGSRYFLAKRKDHFISFISGISMLGIALGVAALITVLSVMNGFSKEIRAKILGFTPHITLKNFIGSLTNWQTVLTELNQFSAITGVAPYITNHGLLVVSGYSKPTMVIGIDPHQTANIYPLIDNIIRGDLNDILPGKFKVLIGEDLAKQFGLNVNDHVALITPQVHISPLGIIPRIKQLTIAAIIKSNSLYDNNHIFLHITDASNLYKMATGISGIQIKVVDALAAPKIAQIINNTFKHKYFITDWTMEFAAFFDAMKMEKTVMCGILCLIIAVAAFNLVAGLIMLVTDKRSDIAILRVMGATTKEIMLIFMLQGSLIGTVGAVLGLGGGLLLAYNVTQLVEFLQKVFAVKFISEEAYFIGFLPSEIHMLDVALVTVIAIFLSFIATLYPAWRASKIQPAEALHYE